MPSLSLSVFCFMPSPWMLLLRPAPGRPRADPVPTPPLPPPWPPSTSFTRYRDREIAVHFEQICTYWTQFCRNLPESYGKFSQGFGMET